MKWIPVFLSLLDHDKLDNAAEMLGVETEAVIGHMVRLWAWGAEHAKDGSLRGIDAKRIASAAHWPANPQDFVDALVGCGRDGKWGFLEDKGDGLVFHDWDEYTGHFIKKSEADVRRVLGWRAQKQGKPSVTRNVTRMSESNIDSPPTEKKEGARGGTEDCYAYVTRNNPEPVPGTDMDTAAVWERTQEVLASEMTRANFETFLADTRLVRCDSQALIAAPSAFQVETLQNRLGRIVSTALGRVIGRPLPCRFIVAPSLFGNGEQGRNEP